MKCLHFNFESHFLEVISSDGSVFKHGPNVIILLEFKFFDHFSCEDLSDHCQGLEFPDVDVSTTVSDERNRLRVFRKRAVFVFAWNLYWEMLDWLVRMKG